MSIEASPLEALGLRQEGEARQRALSLVEKHGERMTPAERKAYSNALVAAKGAGLFPLRRRLHERLFRAYARRRTAKIRTVDSAATLPEGVVAGPYNNRETVDAALRRAASLDPHWVAEFTDLYSAMEALRRQCPIPAPTRA